MMAKKTEAQVDDTTDDGEVAGSGNDARVALLNSINDGLDASRADEMVEIDDAGQVTEFVPSEIEAEAPVPSDDDGTTEKELERMAEEVSETEASPVAPQKFKIKVNGKELELTQEELIERAQKVEAADTYLAEAARLKKQAVQESQPKQTSKETAAVNEREALREMARAIQMGSEEEAIEAIAKLQSRGPSVTADDMARTVDERLNFKEAASKFESEFHDIMGDPVLRKMVLDKDLEALNAGDKRDYYTRYADIGNEVRAWKDGLVKAAVPPVQPKSPAQEKLDRKASVASVPKVASAKTVAPVAEDETEESPSAVIANMAKTRGGPQWMRS